MSHEPVCPANLGLQSHYFSGCSYADALSSAFLTLCILRVQES